MFCYRKHKVVRRAKPGRGGRSRASTTLASAETAVIERIKKARLFVCFQQELGADYRHDRKNKSARFSGYKRHILRDPDTGLARAVGLTPANAPEASVTEGIARQPDTELKELRIDRAELEVYGKAWRVGNGECFPKTEFLLDWEFEAGGVARFPKKSCAAGPLRRALVGAHRALAGRPSAL